jgi:predicted PurR-regulated permease PerM
MTFSDVPFPALMALCVSAVASCLVAILIWRRDEPVIFRIAVTVVAFFPVVGPIFALWVTSFPDRMHPALQARYKNTVNAYSVPRAEPAQSSEIEKGRVDATRRTSERVR